MKKEALDIDNSLVNDPQDPRLQIDNGSAEPNPQSVDAQPLPKSAQLSNLTAQLYTKTIQSISSARSWVADKQNLSASLEGAKHFAMGFALGLLFNVLGFGLLSHMRQKNRKKTGFLCGCAVSFAFYVFFCVTVAAFFQQQKGRTHASSHAHKAPAKRASFALFLSNYVGQTRAHLASAIFFWRKRPVVKSHALSKRQIEIKSLKKKRLDTIHRLRKSFKSRYNFS